MSEPVIGDGATGGMDGSDVSLTTASSSPAQPQPMDPVLLPAFQNHLLTTVPQLVQGNSAIFQQHLDTKETQTILTIFLSDPLAFTIIIHKRVPKTTTGQPNGTTADESKSSASSDDANGLETYSFDLQLKPPQPDDKEKIAASLAFIKTQPTIDLATAPLSAQLLLVSMNESNLFESMLTYVRHCFLPYSRAWMSGSGIEDESKAESDLAVYRGVNRKLGELEVELLRFQENIDIPHIVLDVPKPISDFIRNQRAAGITNPKVEDMGPIASDANFLNDIQRQLNEWKKSILRVTKLTRDVSSGTTIQEVNFWLQMERAINAIYDSKESIPIEFTFNILRQNKRFLATTGFMQDVGLSEEGREKDKVHRYSSFLKDLPIKRLLSSNDLAELIRSLELLFNHIKQIRRIDYPLSRCIALVHTLARDVVTQVQTSILNSKKIMNVPYGDFVSLTGGFEELFSVWTSKVNEFAEMVRALGKKQPGENISKLKEPYVEMDELRIRITEIKKIRKEHEELRNVITSTLTNDIVSKQSALQQIHDAYAYFQDETQTLTSTSSSASPAIGESVRVNQAGGVNVLSITPDGKDAFTQAVAAYSSKIDKVEQELEQKIRQFLDAAKDDSNEMFRVCAKFNPLFIRPRIQSAIREYQEQLIHTVKKDIDALQAKFMNKFAQQEARRMSELLRDLPPVSAMIIWSKQLERQLNMYMLRVESVLGKQWHHHFDGRQLKRDTDDFRARLKPITLYQRWLVNQQEQIANLQVKGPIFRVISTQKHVTLTVNFEKKLITLFKEVRNLTRLEQKIPFDIITAADEAKQNYPFAMRLEEVIRIYSRTCLKLDRSPALQLLAAGHKKAMQESIYKGKDLQWLDSQVKSYVDSLGSQVVEFQDQVEELVNWVEVIEKNIAKLSQILPEPIALKSSLGEIQNVIDHLDKRGFSNLEEYIYGLDQKVESILVSRCQLLIEAFTASLDRDYDEAGHAIKSKVLTSDEKEREDEDEDDEKKEGGIVSNKKSLQQILDTMDTPSIHHEILIRNQMLTIEPSLETSRLHLIKSLHKCISMIAELPRLRTFSADVVVGASGATGADAKSSVEDATYRTVLSKLPTSVLQSCLVAIEKKMSLAAAYMESWMQYQALWDMDMDGVVAELGSDLGRWEQVLLDMKKARATFDSSSTRRRFGPIVVEYGAVQTKVNNKYDGWHKSIMTRFGHLLGDSLMNLFTTLRSGRENLEKHSFDLVSTNEIVESVTLLQGLSKKSKGWLVDLNQYQSIEKLLTKQRYNFPQDWLFTERVSGEWNAFEQILNRKLAKMSEQSSMIQGKILGEDHALEERIKAFTEEWKKSRPVQGDLNHDVAFNILLTQETTLNTLEGDSQRLNMAKKSLDMIIRDGDQTKLQTIREELNGLKEIWIALRVIWIELDQLARTLFKEVKPADLRKSLTRLQNEQMKLPNFMKSYESFEFLKNTIKNYLGMNVNLSDLSSSMLRPKHEKMLLKELGLGSIAWSELTIGQLWALKDFKSHLKAIKAIMDLAQGESALESFLAELKEQWESTKLELVDYKNGKIYLIKNWDPLFAQLNDRLSDLSGMKQSPYFKTFETDALRWEAKLNLAQAIFDVFIDVQRRWLSMSGTFEGSADIQTQLATQYKRFKTFDRDFTRLMRDIYKDNSIDIWVREERNLLQELNTYAETLNNIQKALGDYLEKQRIAFPRFYFIGDDALLEIIGNAKNPVKVVAHLPKLFAGIASLGIVEETKTIQSMISSEGEVVTFIQPIQVTDESSVHSWLNAVQYQMRYTLAFLLERAVEQILRLDSGDGVTYDRTAPGYSRTVNSFFEWVDAFPAQIILLSTQVYWSQSVESALDGSKNATAALQTVLSRIESTLEFLADRILSADISPPARKKYEQLITEKVHQRDATRVLVKRNVIRADDFEWLAQARFYFTPLAKQIELEKKSGQVYDEATEPPVLRCLAIKISRAFFNYGFEYQGCPEKLVQTPLTDRVYLTLAEALHMRLGGNPFGPAGTGKTETVKAMGALLGRMTLVFNCDETFDFQAMGRIFVGLCQCGAWGCFDEFNRLEERILSAVSQQILTIQVGLRESRTSIKLLEKSVKLDPRVGLFITMNPGYAGRSELPDNLKQLFRGMAMVQADRLLIGQVMLYSQGFRTAEDLSSKVGLLFQLCEAQLSSRSHYDFGLRALKSVLRSAGNLKRAFIAQTAQRRIAEEEKTKEAAEDDENKSAEPPVKRTPSEEEQDLLVKSICATISPKLVSADLSLFSTLVRAVFPGAHIHTANIPALREAISKLCASPENSLEDSQMWVDKIMQLNEISTIHHGVIMVGPASTGKTSAWKILRKALEATEGKKISTYVIDPKALTKDELYGSLDSTTLEFTDGVFTHILRKILDNVRGEQTRNHWIILDGDVDPNWVENLNSVLDDNKLLTLPNGERLALTPNIRIMFEVQNLNYATPATVSRCGMVWFSKEVITTPMIILQMLRQLKSETLQLVNVAPSVYARWKPTQVKCVELLEPIFGLSANMPAGLASAQESVTGCFILTALNWVEEQCDHIMTFSRTQNLVSLFSMLKAGISKIIEYNDSHSDFPLSDKSMEAYLSKYLVYSVLWSFGGSLSLKNRLRFSAELLNLIPPSITLPDTKAAPLIDYEVKIDTSDWSSYEEKVETIELEAQKVVKADIVIDTVDTARHTDVVSGWLADHRPLILCGPPGSGKSMTLTAVLRSLPEFELVTLNFSSTTTPKLLLDTLSHYCKVERTPNGLVMHPVMQNKWLVIFCDEINLPAVDQYQTVAIITFLRQIAEHGGFWRASDLSFVKLDRIQFIGACNPPTDAGRVPLSPRFLRHCPLLFVDFPAVPSLKQIYGTFNRALLKLVPSLRSHAESLTDAMIEVYTASQTRFTPDQQSHYIYSPRELSRWVRAMYEAMRPPQDGGGASDLPTLTVEGLVRLWLHEALRLFQDRLVFPEEREWTDATIDGVAKKYWPNIDHSTTLARPVLFSNWLSRQYMSVPQSKLRDHVKTRLRVFYEEELDVKLVIFDEVLDHILRIDRVLRQPLGHLLLVGASGAGKTILSKFVSWMQGMSVFQIKVHRHYSAKDFDKDLRSVLTRAGCKDERICFIFDESNVLNTAFLERMNALLASGEVPGLFEGQDFTALMSECKESCRKEGVIVDTEEELYRHFVGQVQRNLHVVFTMNPASDDFSNRSATSPALFNRCVIDWFGQWSSDSLFQVGLEFTKSLDLGDGLIEESEEAPESKENEDKPVVSTVREAVVSTLVYVHESVTSANQQLSTAHAGAKSSHVTPRHYLDLIKHYATLFNEQRSSLEESQKHLNTGLRKLKETSESVLKLQQALQIKDVELRDKKKLANDKLEQIMVDQREAESKRDISLQIGEEIKVQEAQMAQRKVGVESELMQARPALEEAENAVRSIKKADLDTVSRFPSPPQPVKFALEAVCVMLGESCADWSDLKKVIRRADFIKSVINFDVNLLNEKTRTHLIKNYINDPNFAYDVVNNASKACGPLVKWVASTINFARIKNSVAPLENELKEVAVKQDELKRKQHELQLLRDELGARIDQYKSEYSMLIAEVERIKSEMSTVQTKVDRSMALLTNLGSERGRWELDSSSFQTQINTIVGDCLLSAAFLAYIGYFNQTYRSMLIESWQERLAFMKVPFKKDINLIEYLSSPSERLEWQAHSLPVDDLATENAIMIKRFNRYPLIIDPSGQATAFLMKQYADRKILRTSFLDDAFLKHLESALRFGNALLVEDVENLDPILNSVLNREISKTGGRVMITLGDKEIDYSPSFTIFLSTRDAGSRFAADLCSRVTLVNFSVTPSSLTLQCLSKILRAERNDIDEKRSSLLKLQGEFRVRLRHLEDSLLNALNAVKGNILDSEEIITSLETLKKEAGEVTQKMSESETVMQEVTTVSDSFRPFAVACSSIYFSLEKLADVHFLYQFSLPFFLQIVDRLLFPNGAPIAPELATEKDPSKRLQLLSFHLFSLSYSRVSRALLNDDHVPFGLRLAQVALEDSKLNGWSQIDPVELEFFMKGSTFGLNSGSKSASSTEATLPNLSELGLTRVQKSALGELTKLPAFSRLIAHLTTPANVPVWKRYINAATASQPTTTTNEDGSNASAVVEVDVQTPTGWEAPGSSGDRHVALFHSLLLAKVFRPDRVPALSAQFVSAVFGSAFLRESAGGSNDLARILNEEGSAASPFLLVSRPGFDASTKVDALAASLGPAVQNSYVSMAMGSPEGYEQADQAINAALKKGSMLLLKNVHLSPSYLSGLEKRLHRLSSTAHPSFRLFLTAELSDKLPANLLRMSNLILFEPPVGIKSSLRRSWAALTPERVNRAPAERGRLYFLLAWLHGLILERLRYTPVAWVKPFEFSETDAACSCDAIDEWVDRVAGGRVNLSPEKVPWDAIRSSLELVMYGGRIDNAFDQARLRAFVQSIFTPQAYDNNFPLVSSFDPATNAFKTLLAAPEATTYEGFRTWIEALDDNGSPEFLGLQSSARNMLLVEQAAHTSATVLALQDEQHEEVGSSTAGGSRRSSFTLQSRPQMDRSVSVVAGDASTRPAWMNLMDKSISLWLSKLPPLHAFHDKNVSVKAMKAAAAVNGQVSKEFESLSQNPIYRCLQREFTILATMLETVSTDLAILRDVLAGRIKPDNHVRELLASLRKDALPKGWYRSGMPKNLAPGIWMEDLVRRLTQIQRLVGLKPSDYPQANIWLGGLQAPDGLVAATRQSVAHAHSWPLEQLELKVTVGDLTPNPDSFVFEGLVLHGATWSTEAKGLAIVEGEKLSTILPQVRFTWIKRAATNTNVAEPANGLVQIPVYLDATRQQFLFELQLPQPSVIEQTKKSVWIQRGTCMTVWSSAGHSEE